MKPDTLRAFVALVLPTAGIDCLAGLQQRLRDRGLKLSWVPSRNLHLTMKFLGDIGNADLPAATEALQQAVVDQSPLNLIIQGLGVFPGIKQPRVLWTGLGGDVEPLRSLALRLEKGLVDRGFKADRRAFKAHITLARIRKRVSPQRLLQAMQEVGQFRPQPIMAQRLALFKSDLRPSGAVYTVLSEVLLS